MDQVPENPTPGLLTNLNPKKNCKPEKNPDAKSMYFFSLKNNSKCPKLNPNSRISNPTEHRIFFKTRIRYLATQPITNKSTSKIRYNLKSKKLREIDYIKNIPK